MNSNDLEQTITQSRWIKIPTDLQVPKGTVVRFRGVARLDRVPVSATVSIAASGPYTLYVNGEYVGCGSIPAGSDCVYKDTYDLSGKLKRGPNIIGIEMRAVSTGTAVNLVMGVNTRAGDVEFGSDDTWVCSVADDYEISEYSGGLCEIYNDSGKPGEWLASRFNARGWSTVAVTSKMDAIQIKDRPVAPATVSLVSPAYAQAFNVPERPKDADIAESFEQTLKGDVTLLKAGSVVGLEAIADPAEKKIIKTPRGDRGVAVILDFDKLVDGKLGFSFESSGSGVADVFFATSQPEDGGVPLPDTGLGMMRVNFRKGEMDIRSLVSRQSRFIQIEFRRCSKPVTLKTVNIEVGSYASDKNTHFECNRGTLTGLWEQCAERATSLISSIAGVHTTSVGLDATTFTAVSRAAYYLYGDVGISSYLLDSIESWCSDPLDVPSILSAYTELSGDSSRVCALYDVLKLHMEKYWAMRNVDGLVKISGKVSTIPNLKLCRALESMSVAAWICGKEDDAYSHHDKAVILRKAVLGRLFDERKGLFCSGLDGWRKIREYATDVNLEAACAGILDQYERNRIYHWLARPELETALTPEQAAALAMQLTADKQLDGAMEIIGSTLGSLKGAVAGYNVLACVGLFAIVGGVLGVKRVLGVKGRYSVSPARVGLKQADSSVVVPEGEMLIGWRGTRNGTLMQIDVPENVRIDVYIGDDFGNSFRLNGRSLVNGCVSLSAGSHRIHCSDVGARRPTPDKSLLPEVPWASVEVLDGVSQYGVRERSGRGGDRRRRKEDEPIAVATDNLEVAETVVETAVPQEVRQEDKSKRRKRTGRGRKPEEAPVQPVAEAPEQLLDEPAVQPAIDSGQSTIGNETSSPEAAAEARPKRRRRTRRRKPAEIIEGAAVVEMETAPADELVSEQEEQPSDATEVVEAQAETVGETRSRRRRRSRSRRKPEETIEEAVSEIDVVTVEEPVVEEEQDTIDNAELPLEVASETRSRRRRRSRSRHKHVEPEAIDNGQLTTDNEEIPAESGELEVESIEQPVDESSIPPEVPVAVPHKHRRRSRSKRKPVEFAEVDSEPDEVKLAAELGIPVEYIEPMEQLPEGVVEDQPKRRNNTRRRKPASKAESLSVDDLEYDPFAEPVTMVPVQETPPLPVEDVPVVEEPKPKPQPRRRTPRKKPEATAEIAVTEPVQPVVEQVPEMPDETVAEVKKPRRRRSPAKPVENSEVLPEATDDVE